MECTLGFRGDREYTQEEVALMMGVNQATVSRLARKAFIHLEGALTTLSNRVFSDPAPPVGAYDLESDESEICISPFVPSRYGLSPGTRPAGTERLGGPHGAS